MSDFFGSLIKGIQPIMDAAGIPKDESFSLITQQSELKELREKIDSLYGKAGRMLYEQHQKGLLNTPEYESVIREIDELNQELQLSESNLNNLRDALEEKENEKNRAIAVRTCRNCGFENAEGRKFCQECGTKLEQFTSVVCPACGVQNDDGVKFCGNCGKMLY